MNQPKTYIEMTDRAILTKRDPFQNCYLVWYGGGSVHAYRHLPESSDQNGYELVCTICIEGKYEAPSLLEALAVIDKNIVSGEYLNLFEGE